MPNIKPSIMFLFLSFQINHTQQFWASITAVATHRPIPRTFRFDQQTATKSLRTFLKCNFNQNLTFLHFRLGQSLHIFSFQNEIHSVFGGNHFRRWWWKDQRANQAQMYFFSIKSQFFLLWLAPLWQLTFLQWCWWWLWLRWRWWQWLRMWWWWQWR